MQNKGTNRAPVSRKAKDSLIILLLGTLGALLFSLMDGDLSNPGRMIGAVIVGIAGSGIIVLNEIWLAKPFLRKMKFRTVIIYKSVLYTAFFAIVILLVVAFERSVEAGVSFFNYLGSDSFNNLVWKEDLHIMIIFALAATSGFILVYQVSRKMGQGVLWNFISGRYHKPREEERIFMFMDLTNSTSLAEDLGDIEYNKLLNDFFFDITESIISNYGEIYRYVGDEVAVSWRPSKGLKNAHCIRAFFDAKKAIHSNREKYLTLYGLVPTFTAGFHIGHVVVGEIGEIKSQISFIGNVMYETGEIEKSCKKNSVSTLISEPLLSQIELPAIFTAQRESKMEQLDSKPIPLFSMVEN